MRLVTPSRRPAAGAPSSRSLALRVLVLAVLAMLAVLGPLGAPAALAEPPRSVSVVDDADILNDGPLAARLEQISFRKDVDLVALTLDVVEFDASPSSDIALNDATLALARRDHPEWLSPDGMKWRDGLVIIAIDPGNRFLGTYAGEDVKLTDPQYQQVQDEMRTPARDGAWDDAIAKGAEEYASILARPWYLKPGTVFRAVATIAVGGIAVLGVIGGFFARRGRSRRRVDHALLRYDDVMLHYAETELAAKTIPRDSPYGEPVLRDYQDFQRAAAEATRLREALPAQRSFWWGAGGPTRRLAQDFADATAQIDAMDDEIVATNDLLNLSNRWHDAWEREMKPVRDSLAEVESVVRSAPTLADSPSARALREVAGKVDAGLRTTTRELENGALAPDAALAELDEMTSALSRAGSAHRDAIIAATARDDEEARIMRDAQVGGPTGDGYDSIRGRRYHYHPHAYATGWSLSPILWLSSWNSSAGQALDTHRNPPSTASHSGYSSSSSGGFSGSGSSSRF